MRKSCCRELTAQGGATDKTQTMINVIGAERCGEHKGGNLAWLRGLLPDSRNTSRREDGEDVPGRGRGLCKVSR